MRRLHAHKCCLAVFGAEIPDRRGGTAHSSVVKPIENRPAITEPRVLS
ncbi:hypothetical protein GFS60_06934 (plasmid) [Rhodococcus sp. WAY2]|nr:hypothetical protein GFS60_06934 [Rhodococcus sp. WAY2]